MKSLSFDTYYKDKLLSIPLFNDLSSSLKNEILKKLDFKLYEYEENTVVIEQGNMCCNLYVLLEGVLEVHIIDANGNEVLIEHIEAPRTFATPHLFKKDNRFPATFKTVERSVLLTATKDSTFELISRHPDILKSFLCVSGNCNVCTTLRLDVLSRKTIRERILVYLLKRLEKGTSIVKVVHTLTQLAEYINVTRPALSTEFNKMEKEGLIRRKENNYIELNLKVIKGIV
ncbi:Crp/Fnr family transcriptional regulator [Bacteroides mediterraneensis]|uniref:Crp/Fnr family transcriptional regulator n=1 Tax=Bacteroides mediterraneensis TaxID=1841856 RepID=UPI0026ED19BA|nr:Crp/Fnr family transcriptional regulator [Bacteroides mediterraneensis]